MTTEQLDRLIVQAEEEAASGNFFEAIKLYQHLQQLVPDSHEAAIGILNALSDSGRYHEIIKILDERLQIDGDQVWIHLRLAESYVCLKDYQKALDHYLTVYHLDESEIRAIIDLSYIYFMLDDLENAMFFWKKARYREPDYASLYMNYAFICQKQGNDEEAEANFEKAIALDPTDVRIYTGYGDLKYNQYRFEDAMRLYRLGLTHASHSWMLHRRCALCCYQTQQWDEAIYHITRASELNVVDKSLHKELINIYSAVARKRMNELCFKEAFRLINISFKLAMKRIAQREQISKENIQC